MSYSFVIPVLNEQDNIAELLSAIEEKFPDAQTIVVDGGSSDDTVPIALPVAHLLLTGAPGRAQQMNLGADSSSKDYLIFLHADSFPSFGQAFLLEVLSQEPAWGFCRVQLSGTSLAFRIIEWAMNTRSRLTRIATGDQMLFVRRDLFLELGGYADIPLMEDVELCKRLRASAKPQQIQQTVKTSSRRWEANGVIGTMVQMWWLRLAYFFGVSPQRLWRTYYGG
ncbi:MAG: TIGR04283 family arsenosugar biosynthesis glycosyltransferase [Halioglobus sp.]